MATILVTLLSCIETARVSSDECIELDRICGFCLSCFTTWG
jgi:hypothetical protein